MDTLSIVLSKSLGIPQENVEVLVCTLNGGSSRIHVKLTLSHLNGLGRTDLPYLEVSLPTGSMPSGSSWDSIMHQLKKLAECMLANYSMASPVQQEAGIEYGSTHGMPVGSLVSLFGNTDGQRDTRNISQKCVIYSGSMEEHSGKDYRSRAKEHQEMSRVFDKDRELL